MTRVFAFRREQWWGVLAVFFCGFVVWFPITDSDIWWHLAAGREILARKAFLFSDPFSFTTVGLPWYDVHWLFQLVMYGIHCLAGNIGLVCIKCLLFVAAGAVVFSAIPGKRNWFFSSAVFCLFAYAIRYQITERPILFTLVFIALFVFILERHGKGEKVLPLLLLIPLQALWVNSQGLFGLGLAIFCIYAVGGALDSLLERKWHPDEKKQVRKTNQQLILTLGLVGAGLVLACLASPYGWRSFYFGAKLLGCIVPETSNVFSTSISENAPLFSLIGTAQAGDVLVALFSVLLAIFSFIIAGRRVRSAHGMLVILFGALAFMADRNVVLLVFVAAPIITWNFGNAALSEGGMTFRFTQNRAAMLSAKTALVFIMVIYALSHVLILTRAPRQSAVAPFRFPQASVAYLRAHPVAGNMFNTDRFGGYLFWELYPSDKVFIDGRFTLRDGPFLEKYLATLHYPAVHFPGIVREYEITHVVLQTAIFPLYSDLAAYLYHDPYWRLVSANGAEAIFVADSQGTTPRINLGAPEDVGAIVRNLNETWRNDPAIYRESLFYLAGFLQTVGENRSAEIVRGYLLQRGIQG